MSEPKTIRGKNGKFMHNWRYDLVKQMAAQSRANIERANKKATKGATKPMNYTPTEKKAAQIVDQLCPVIVAETGIHVGPKLFKALTMRLAELLGQDICQTCLGTGLDKLHQWEDGSYAACEKCEGYGTRD